MNLHSFSHYYMMSADMRGCTGAQMLSLDIDRVPKQYGFPSKPTDTTIIIYPKYMYDYRGIPFRRIKFMQRPPKEVVQTVDTTDKDIDEALNNLRSLNIEL